MRGTLRPKEPTERELASRPDNPKCLHCGRYIHKYLMAEHLQKKHRISAEEARSIADALIRPRTVVHDIPKRNIQTFSLQKKNPSISSVADKRRMMKELFRDI